MTRVQAMRLFLAAFGLPFAAANTCVGTPHVGPMQDASSCSNLAHCGECQVQCNCQGLGNDCLGSSTLLRCLGHNDPIRNLSKDQFQYGTCNTADTSPVGLVAPDPCGYELCCPASPFVPTGCFNAIEQRLGMAGQCQAMIASGTYSCEASFCHTCGPLAGQCDQYCGYGLCAVCGDCWPSARIPEGRTRCDDGNSQDGDGCSSTCEVEAGWTCTREEVPIMNTALNIQTIISVDRCRKCSDSPVGWIDSQGYTCQDYELFGACDAESQPSDPLVTGGRTRATPEYFQYQFLYDLNITPSQPLMMIVSVQAAANAHVFLGKPREYGFEIVLGGWDNGQSVLREYPTTNQLDNKYAAVLNQSSMSNFWVYYTYDGNISIGQGKDFWQGQILHGSTLSMQSVQNNGWIENDLSSSLNQVSITTGWSSSGVWDVRLLQGFAGLTLQDMANGGVDASSACCACGGGVFGRPCEQRTTGALPWMARTNVNTISRRLAGGFQNVMLMGAPSVDGFALNIQFQDCQVASNCKLDAIVVPTEAKDKIITPLQDVWTQVMKPSCRLFGHSQVTTYYIWQTTGCNFTAGALYAVAMYLTTTAGSHMHIMDLQVAGLPSSAVSAVTFKDHDVRAGYMRGEVTIEGVADESNVLQYRTFFGESADRKIGFINDDRAAKIGWINTYAAGGLRSGFNNECLYGDCNWEMQMAKSAGNGRPVPQYILRHKNTGYCLCYPFQELKQEPCPAELLTLDTPVTYKYTPTGNGALLDRNNAFFKTVWYRDIGARDVRTFDSVKALMEEVCNDMLPCVGILIADPGYDAILLLDRRYGTSEYPGTWPPDLHPLLVNIGAEQAWEAYGTSEALAPANPSRTSLDIVDDPFWWPWRAYIREVQEDCLWTLQDRIFNGTVESRLMSSAAHDCLCQVPAQTDRVGPDGLLAPVQDTMWHHPKVGKFCDSMVLDFKINEKEVRTTGYCEWELHPSVPSDYVIGLDATMNDSVTTSGNVNFVNFQGVDAWQLTGDGQLQIPDTILASNYTLAAWVNIPSFNFANASLAGSISIFDALGLSGNKEPCLQVEQRAQLDGRAAYCGGDFLCNRSQMEACCYFGFGTSTTMTTTSTTWVNQTMDDDFDDPCGCSCVINMTDEVAEEYGTPLPGDRWGLQLRSCDSEVPWDSGADVMVPHGGSSNWLLLVATADSEMSTFYTSQALAPEVVTYNHSFGCSSPGCVAKVIFRDIPRDPSRTCALDVDIYVTDFTNNAEHANPEVVEVINVRGSAPVNSRDVRRNCHPDGANQLDRLYNCVHKENVDEWVLSPSGDRAIRVDLKITEFVDAYPKNGMYLSGFAAISCAQITPPPRGLPKSGSIHALGSVKRSCTGSTLNGIGGTMGATDMGDMPSVYISQAWVFPRMLSEDELMALHLGTRTRYYRDYQIPVQSTEIVKPGAEVVVSGFMQCEFAGCSASVTLQGLPTNGDAQCFLTFKVRITDFSGPEEVVEYIRIDDLTVVERCWPQADGNPDAFYYCADSLDVSMAVLKSSFLRDGVAVVSAKISEDVDIMEYRYQNRFMLHAEVEIRCLGGRDKEVLETLQVQPEVTHILAVPINAQGEGPMNSAPFVDSSNGFIGTPNIPFLTTGAVQVNVEGAFEGQFWAFVTYRVDDAFTMEEIYNGSYLSKAICESPQRARGQLTLKEFQADPFLVNCEFEPGIAYTLILYLDALQAPFGGGELLKLPFTGVMPAEPANTPLLRARGMSFLDTNPLAAKVYGTLTITSAASEADVTHYHVYYGFFGRIWPDGSEPLAIIPATGAYEYSILVNAQLLPSVNTFLVYCKNSYGESTLERRLGILDSSMIMLQNPSIVPSYNNGNLYLEVTTLMSGPGARVDVAVVPDGVEVDARTTTDYRELDFGPISSRSVCTERDIQYDLTSGSKVIGPCFMLPNKEYTVIVHVAIRYDCPCTDPCYCTGQMSFVSQAPSAGLTTSSTGRIILPDTTAPTLSLYECGSSCNLDSKLRLTGHVEDTGDSYPVVTMCAACVPPYDPNTDPAPQALDPPRTCLRNGDAAQHRYWRIRIPQGSACVGKSTINIMEAEFYQVSPLERTGVKVTPIAILAKVPEIAGANKEAAFDGSTASAYLMDTQFDAWIGIDVGIGNQEAILRVRAFWESGCVPSKLVLEWSDDIITWTERMTTMPDTSQTMTDVFVDAAATNWTSGAFYQVAFTAESQNNILIEGVTPGSAYHIHCWSVDAANTAGPEQEALAVTTVDFVSPFLQVSNAMATDYTAKVDLYLRDAGKAYPALSTCVARELTQTSEAPAVEELSSRGQKCHYMELKADVNTQDGRVVMTEVFGARLLDRDLRIQQSQWGGHRQDYQSCGFNHEPMAQPGGCTARSSKQKVSFLATVKAPRDIYIFIGPETGIGYEILLGGWQNLRVTLARGYSRDPRNEGQAEPAIMVSYSNDGNPILDQYRFKTFWVDADPMTGLIRVGSGEIFGHNILITANDTSPISPLPTVMVGTQHTGNPCELYMCPRVGNLLQGRSITSSSVAFNGVAEKAVDGQWGDNTFCEYCAQNDPLHVCASTRRQDTFSPPSFRINMGTRLYLIKAIRLVVPTDGRPEQSAEWSVFVGTTGFRSDVLCTTIADARGDHIWPCENPVNGNWVSVWGNVNQLKVLPEEFGIRICEIEAYAHLQDSQRREDIIDQFDLRNGLPPWFPTDSTSETVEIYGLQPNRSYEVFCYSEDLYGNLKYSQTAPLTVKTTDTTAPKLQIHHIYPMDLSITVEVKLEDPGDAYPALARCMATTQDGKAPQEHDAYFEHRFWRIRFVTAYTNIDSSCADRVLLRSLDLQSWGGETFRRHMFSSDPDLPQDTIGLDTDDNGLIDSFEIAAWSVPQQDAWVGIDLQYLPESVSQVRSRGFMLQGDLVVAIRWEGNVDDLDLSVLGPGSEYMEFNLTEGDFYRVSDFGIYAVPCNPGDGCTTPVRSSLFVLALPGDYDVMVYRRTEGPWSALTISTHVRLCGQDLEYQMVLPADEQNETIRSGLRVPFTGCHRKPQAAVQNLRVWQSTVHGGGPSEKTMWYLADDNPSSCMETGGTGSATPDEKPWWRVSLERTQLLQGLWLAGQAGPGVASHADVFTSVSTQEDVGAVVNVDSYNGQIFYVYNASTQYCYRVTIGQLIEEDRLSSASACDTLGFTTSGTTNYFLIGSYASTTENEQHFEKGMSCNNGQRSGVLNTMIRSDSGVLEVTVREIRPCFYEATLHVPLSTVLQSGTLCAENVPIGVLEDPFQVPVTRACFQESRGSTVWVVAKYGRLRLCEVEIFTEPLPTVTQVSFDYGASGNESVGAVCGANNISIEFSDDNVTWLKAWDAWADGSVFQKTQFARWSWWQRLFALPFHTNFSQAEARNVTIPSLRENSSYDVLCWATDAIGNDIMQSMVMLPLPWADTRKDVVTTPVNYPGARRLQEDNETWKCDGWIRELMPCEEEVATSDRAIPRVIQGLLVDVQSTTEGFFTGNTERASFRLELRDGSCNNRVAGSGTECHVICRVLEQDLSWLSGSTWSGVSSCLYPRCDEKAWSNEYPVYLSFGMLQPGQDYTVVCYITDPWFNQATQEFTLSIPALTTQTPQSTEAMSTQNPWTPPPATQPPTAPPRTTQAPEYWTRAPTVRTTARASSTIQSLAFTTTERTWESRTTDEPTTTTTTTPVPLATLPPWLKTATQTGPVRTEMTLSASTREDAEEMVLPAAMGAVRSALRTSLQLGPLDELTILGTEIYSEGSSGRRLSVRWLVRIRFTVEAYNAVQSNALLQRVGQLGLTESTTSKSFQEELTTELAQRGSQAQVDFVGSTPLQEGAEWSPVPSPSPAGSGVTTTTVERTDPSTPTAGDEGESTFDGMIIPVAIAIVCACIGLLVAGTVYAICSARPPSSPQGKLSKVANSNQALSTAESNPALFVPRTPSGRALLPDLRETAKAELQSVESIEEPHRKFRHSPTAGSTRSGGSRGRDHVVNVK